MSLQISAFKGFLLSAAVGQIAQVADGEPVNVAAVTGSYTVPAGCTLLRIEGTGTITWSNSQVETLTSALEWRGTRPGATFTVA